MSDAAAGRAVLIVTALAVAVCVKPIYLAARRVRDSSPESVRWRNVQALTGALAAYCQRNDGRLPPTPTVGDWAVRKWKVNEERRLWGWAAIPRVAEEGPLRGDDRTARGRAQRTPDGGWTVQTAYVCNLDLSGSRLVDVMHRPLIWESSPGGKHGRWVATITPGPGYAPGRCYWARLKWVKEEDFAQVIREAQPLALPPFPEQLPTRRRHH